MREGQEVARGELLAEPGAFVTQFRETIEGELWVAFDGRAVNRLDAFARLIVEAEDRLGRDGEPAEAWMIYGLQDVVRLRQMVDDSEADEAHKRHDRQKLDALLGWCEITACRRRPVLRRRSASGAACVPSGRAR